MIRSVIFDRDGVLVDSNNEVILAWQLTGERLGYEVPDKEFFRKMLGIAYPKVLEMAYGKDERIIKTYKEIRVSGVFGDVKLMPGLEIAMEKIELPKAIVTTGSLYTTRLMLKDLLKYFQVVVTKEDTTKHKPNPEPLLLACEELKTKPKEAVYLGDTIIDYKTANNAGTEFAGFLSNGATREEFEQAGVETTIKSLDEVPSILKKFKM